MGSADGRECAGGGPSGTSMVLLENFHVDIQLSGGVGAQTSALREVQTHVILVPGKGLSRVTLRFIPTSSSTILLYRLVLGTSSRYYLHLAYLYY